MQIHSDPTHWAETIFFSRKNKVATLLTSVFFSFQKALLELNKSPLFQSIISPDTRSLGVSLGSEDLNSNIMNIPQVESFGVMIDMRVSSAFRL
jgi:hypothetical protein